MSPPTRFRFGPFVLSPARRELRRGAVPVPLIPRYFDLLLLLVRRRHEAVSKQEIFDIVWRDVVVSDGALAQAVRTLRRTLGDDPRDPKYIRTVSRHGYQFVWPHVVEEPDGPGTESGTGSATSSALVEVERAGGIDADLATTAGPAAGEGLEDLVATLLDLSRSPARDDEAREVAERLHQIGTADAVALLRRRPGHARALALMRDARWAVPGSGAVPLLSDPERGRAIAALVRLRAADVGRMVARRWTTTAVA
ncbi:MAG TPA: winged helix-turn-helix domain-containing protein, partial [Vicinamibacterales bacterium]|nr:winged helix-turn-helix domain-containing protein [Vicinamibacterales bacterium]